MRHERRPQGVGGGLVYATDAGRMCPACRRPVADCVCAATKKALLPRSKGVAHVSRESKGRGGKTVTLIRDLALNAIDLAALGKRLKTACGSGGTVKDGVIEVQGDHCERVLELLKNDGIEVKCSGG